MTADEIQRAVERISREHDRAHEEPGMSLDEVQRRVQACDVCMLLIALHTTVNRRWDPFNGGPLR